MSRDDIIRMAREAGLKVGTNISGITLVGAPIEHGLAHLTIDELERFAALVEKNLIQQGYRKCAKGQRTTQYCGMLEDAVKAEREALRADAERLEWIITKERYPLCFYSTNWTIADQDGYHTGEFYPSARAAIDAERSKP